MTNHHYVFDGKEMQGTIVLAENGYHDSASCQAMFKVEFDEGFLFVEPRLFRKLFSNYSDLYSGKPIRMRVKKASPPS